MQLKIFRTKTKESNIDCCDKFETVNVKYIICQTNILLKFNDFCCFENIHIHPLTPKPHSFDNRFSTVNLFVSQLQWALQNGEGIRWSYQGTAMVLALA